MKFSQRIGKTLQVKSLQLESIDIDLKNGLWNVYKDSILDKLRDISKFQFNPYKDFSFSLWHNFYKLPLNQKPYFQNDFNDWIYKWFIWSKREWYEIYDILDFTISLISDRRYELPVDEIQKNFNGILEREFSAYRFINNQLCPISNEIEVKSLENALSKSDVPHLKSVNIHLNTALSLLSNRNNPDYRNSIKESISAVESICKIISNNTSDSLGGALGKIKGKIKIHQALEQGFKNLYGYTSDTDGIRHALMNESNCDFEDANFMLVSCSGFINYLISKSNKYGISLNATI